MASWTSGATSASGTCVEPNKRHFRFGDPVRLLDTIRETITTEFCKLEDAAYKEVLDVHSACRTTEDHMEFTITGLKEQNEKLRQGIIDQMYGLSPDVDIAVEGDDLAIDMAWLWYYNNVFTPYTLIIPDDSHVQWLYSQSLAEGKCE